MTLVTTSVISLVLCSVPLIHLIPQQSFKAGVNCSYFTVEENGIQRQFSDMTLRGQNVSAGANIL